MAITGIAHTLSKFADDMCWFLCQNFDFIKLSDEMTTGSSIMPHKKNPDVLELVRAKCNAIQGRLSEVMFITTGLTSGYHRDFQMLKDPVADSLYDLNQCLDIMCFVLPGIKVDENIMGKDMYKYVWSVDSINEKVQEGIPFRDAYTQVAMEINTGRFRPGRPVQHTHTGSIGNLSNDRISEKLEMIKKKTDILNYLNFRDRFIKNTKNENAI
jgi:argininosuccinate lyase